MRKKSRNEMALTRRGAIPKQLSVESEWAETEGLPRAKNCTNWDNTMETATPSD